MMNALADDSPYCRLCGNLTSNAEAINIFEENDATLKFIVQVRLQIKVY